MGVFFVALIILYFFLSLSVKSDERARQRDIEDMEAAYRKGMGHGRDNIYQFKIYCYNMRCLLELAQMDGIGVDEERNEKYYDKHCKEISEKYCDGKDPMHWCMHKAIETIIDRNYINSWQYSECGESYHDKRDLAYDPLAEPRYRYENTWIAFKSGYNRDTWTGFLSQSAKNIKLPKDGVTGADKILRGLYYLNHAFEFENINSWGETLEYYSSINPGKKFSKKYLYFEESGITLQNKYSKSVEEKDAKAAIQNIEHNETLLLNNDPFCSEAVAPESSSFTIK